MLRSRTIARSYSDRPDTSERVFVVYNLSRYNNRAHYFYTETSDMYFTELYLRSRVPLCVRVCYYPIDEVATGLDSFENMIAPKKVTHPFLDSHTVFAVDEPTEMEDIIVAMDQIFCDHVTRSDGG